MKVSQKFSEKRRISPQQHENVKAGINYRVAVKIENLSKYWHAIPKADTYTRSLDIENFILIHKQGYKEDIKP